MKKFYLFFIFLTGLTAQAQNYIITPSKVVNTVMPLNTYTTAEIDFEHNTVGPLNLAWNVIDIVIPQGWDYSYCDYNTCYLASDSHGAMATVNSGEHGFIKVNLSATTAGWAHFTFEVFEVSNPTATDTVEFWFNGVAAVKEVPVSEISLFPNPVSQGENSVLKNLPLNTTVEIYNSLGQKIRRINSGNQTSVSLGDELNRGVYLIRMTIDGKTETRKLIVK